MFPLTSFATILSGTVTSGTGSFVKLSVPFAESNPNNTVGDDNFQSANLYGFDEDQNINITTDLTVDILAYGMGGGSGSGTVLSGSTVASHYIFFDPGVNTTIVGTVTFDSEIFGIITSRSNLIGSDGLANTGVTYLSDNLRGLESVDSVTITGLDTIEIDFRANSPGDYIRVLTDFSPGAVVPVPAADWLLSSALPGFAGIAKRSRS